MKLTWKFHALAAVVTSLVCMTCFNTLAVAADVEVKVGGTGSAVGVMRLLGTAFEKANPGIKIKVMPSLGSSAGIKALAAGAIHVGIASRPLKDNELKAGVQGWEFARTPLVFATHSRVNKKSITARELEEYYTRPDAAWPDKSRIRLILRPEQDTDSLMIAGISPGMPQALKAAHGRSGMILAITDQEASENIIKTSGSLGAASLAEIVSEKLPLNILSFNGITPSIKTLADRSYPLVKPLIVAISPTTSPEGMRFVEFVRSPAAIKILQANGCLPSKTR